MPNMALSLFAGLSETAWVQILLVNTRPPLVSAVQSTIVRLGVVVKLTEIESGDDLRWAMGEHGPYDLAFVDVAAGFDDGYRPLMRLRVVQPSLRLIVVRAFDGDVDISRAHKMGISTFVSDTPGVGDLVDIILYWNSGRQRTSPDRSLSVPG